MDNAKFCSNARGSCWEVLDHLLTARDEGLIPAELLTSGQGLVDQAVRLLNGYLRYLQQTGSRKAAPPPAPH
jgi:four helix bundle protein